MELDDNLYIEHRHILDITFLDDNNNIKFNNITYLSNLYISGSTIIGINTTINSYLYITNNSLLNNVTANSISIINQSSGNLLNSYIINIKDTLINNNLYNASDIIMYKSGSILSTLHTYNLTANTIITNNITSNNIAISSNIINIGTTNSKINIYAESINSLANETIINDNVLELNINITTLTAFDIGNQSGFEILGTDGNNGFIKTNILSNLFEIKYPKKILTEYILNVDDANNLTILGTTNIINNLTINSSLYVANKSFLNNISITSILYSKDNINTYNTSTAYSIVYINNKLISNNNIKIINSNLIVNNNSIFSNNTSILSNIDVEIACIINNNNVINSDIYVNNDINLNNDIYIDNNLSVSNNTIINNSLTILSFLNLHNNCAITNNLTINSNLNLGNIKNNAITITSNLNILGNGILNNNNTLCSMFNTVSMLGTVLLSNKILDYTSSDLAAIEHLSIGKLYRTGAILKIKIAQIVPPIMTLTGMSIITLLKGRNYIEEGVSSISSNGDILKSYIISIGNNILPIPIEAIINSTIVTLGLTIGIYNIIYKSSDNDNNIQYITRTLNISENISVHTMKLIGDNPTSLTIKSNYNEYGVISSSYYNNNLKSYIISIGDTIFTPPIEVVVNMYIPLISNLPLGTYDIVYKSTDSVDDSIQNITRTLIIIENKILPSMKLIGPSIVSSIQENNYNDLGVTSKSVYNEILKSYIISIGSNIISEPLEALENMLIPLVSTLPIGIYDIVYKSTDNDGNIQNITRTLDILNNKIPPIMELIGLTKLHMQYDDIYIEPGIISTDYYKTVLRSYIISIGTTVFSRPIEAIGNTILDLPQLISYSSGEYIILYQCTDIYGNIQNITRTLVILTNLKVFILDINNKLNNYDTTIVNNNKLLLKTTILDINLTLSSIINKFNNYDTSITNDSKILLKANSVNVTQNFLDINNKFNNYDTTINSDIKLNNIYIKFNNYDTSNISNTKLSLKDNILDVRSTIASILTTINDINLSLKDNISDVRVTMSSIFNSLVLKDNILDVRVTTASLLNMFNNYTTTITNNSNLLLKDNVADVRVTTTSLFNSLLLKDNISDVSVTTTSLFTNLLLKDNKLNIQVTTSSLFNKLLLKDNILDVRVTTTSILDTLLLKDNILDVRATTTSLLNMFDNYTTTIANNSNLLLKDNIADVQVTTLSLFNSLLSKDNILDVRATTTSLLLGLSAKDNILNVQVTTLSLFNKLLLKDNISDVRATTTSLFNSLALKDNIADVHATATSLLNMFNNYTTTFDNNINLLVKDNVADVRVTTASLFNSLILKDNIADVSITTTSILNNFNNYTTTIANNSNLLLKDTIIAVRVTTSSLFTSLELKDNIADVQATTTSLLNMFNNYTTTIANNSNLLLKDNKLDVRVTTLSVFNSLALKDNIIDIQSTTTSLLNNFNNYTTIITNNINLALKDNIADVQVTTSSLFASLALKDNIADVRITTSSLFTSLALKDNITDVQATTTSLFNNFNNYTTIETANSILSNFNNYTTITNNSTLLSTKLNNNTGPVSIAITNSTGANAIIFYATRDVVFTKSLGAYGNISVDGTSTLRGGVQALDTNIIGDYTITLKLTITGSIIYNPYWCAGVFNGSTMAILSSIGIYGYSITRTEGFAAGGYTITMSGVYPNNTYIISGLSMQSFGFIKVNENTYNNFTFPIEAYNLSSVSIDTIVHFCVYRFS